MTPEFPPLVADADEASEAVLEAVVLASIVTGVDAVPDSEVTPVLRPHSWGPAHFT